ncbi:hypothetical protein [Oceanicola sp. S124]|uniref:hypothetical protein n=1 Tax=Oceanicola sp. S124 TaxID=1042378 RepID=UPI000255826A|nr:hypothetical protein [Oceanicola sp. S124]
MANIHDCLQRAVDAGDLDKTRAEEAGTQFEQLLARYETTMPRHAAEAAAAADLKEATRQARRSRHHKVVNQLQAQRRLHDLITTAKDPARALINLLEWSEGSGFQGESVQSLANALMRDVNAELNEVLRATGRNMIGNSRDPVRLRKIIQELHLEDSGDPGAKAMAEAVRKVQNRLRRMFNAHGGDIGELADFGVSHSHDVAALRRVGFDEWAKYIMPLLDWSRIRNHSTGKPFTTIGGAPRRADANAFLSQIYEGIVTRGWNDKDPSMTVGGKALYNTRAEHRELHFRGGSAWMDYNARFGTSDPFSAMIGGLHGMARDIAQMRVLGPNPKMGLEYATQVAKRQASLEKDAVVEQRINKAGERAQTMLAHFSGAANSTNNEVAARFFSNTRKLLTSIQLGSAPLSAVTDIVTIRMGARASGLNPNNVMARSVKLLASSGERDLAARLGYVADTLAEAGSTAARFTGDVIGGEFAERVSGFTMRASGLAFWTDMNRNAFRMEFSAYLAQNADQSFDQIDEPLRDLFKARGITRSDWELLRAPDGLFTAGNGATFLSPQHWRYSQKSLPPAEAEGLSLRLNMLIEEQMEVAIPSANLEARAFVLGSTSPGTPSGEFMRSTLMYKSFALSLMLAQYRRYLAQPTPWNRLSYAAKMGLGLTLMGGMAIQLKELAKGNDPRPMDEAKFWGGAILQGGGAGIFGDFFAATESRVGGSFEMTLAGPVTSFGGDVIGLVGNPIHRAISGDSFLLGRDAANFVGYNTPVFSSLWYARLAYGRAVADQLRIFLDPEAERLMRQQERRQQRDFGTGSWWHRGQLRPERGPDFSNIVGGER